MAFSKCSKCDSTYFEVVENSPSNSNFKLFFVQCSRCGSVIGAMDYFNIGTRIKEVENKIDALSSGSSNLNSVNNNLNVINQNIAKLFSLVKSIQKD